MAKIRPIRPSEGAAVVACTEQPFPVEAVVLEEDTGLVLSADPRVRETREHPIRIMTDLYDQKLLDPGTILVTAGRPIRIQAIVHELDEDPSWREEWIQSALLEVFAYCTEHEVVSLGLEPLGGRHGTFQLKRILALLEALRDESSASFPRRIWIMVD